MPDKAKDVFSSNLRYLLSQNDLSQVEFAEKLGLKTSTLSDWINGRKYPRVDSMQMIADYFGIAMSELVSENLINSKTAPHQDGLTEEQHKAIDLLQALPDDKRQEALRYLEFLVSSQGNE